MEKKNYENYFHYFTSSKEEGTFLIQKYTPQVSTFQKNNCIQMVQQRHKRQSSQMNHEYLYRDDKYFEKLLLLFFMWKYGKEKIIFREYNSIVIKTPELFCYKCLLSKQSKQDHHSPFTCQKKLSEEIQEYQHQIENNLKGVKPKSFLNDNFIYIRQYGRKTKRYYVGKCQRDRIFNREADDQQQKDPQKYKQNWLRDLGQPKQIFLEKLSPEHEQRVTKQLMLKQGFHKSKGGIYAYSGIDKTQKSFLISQFQFVLKDKCYYCVETKENGDCKCNNPFLKNCQQCSGQEHLQRDCDGKRARPISQTQIQRKKRVKTELQDEENLENIVHLTFKRRFFKPKEVELTYHIVMSCLQDKQQILVQKAKKNHKWLYKFTCEKVQFLYYNVNRFYVNIVVKELMKKQGLNKVRGGHTSQLNLSCSQIKSLYKQMNRLSNQCYKCGEGHNRSEWPSCRRPFKIDLCKDCGFPGHKQCEFKEEFIRQEFRKFLDKCQCGKKHFLRQCSKRIQFLRQLNIKIEQKK